MKSGSSHTGHELGKDAIQHGKIEAHTGADVVEGEASICDGVG